jgi:hypothetical protein
VVGVALLDRGAGEGEGGAVFFHHWHLMNRSFDRDCDLFNPVAYHSNLQGSEERERVTGRQTSTMSQHSLRSIERNCGISPVVIH